MSLSTCARRSDPLRRAPAFDQPGRAHGPARLEGDQEDAASLLRVDEREILQRLQQDALGLVQPQARRRWQRDAAHDNGHVLDAAHDRVDDPGAVLRRRPLHRDAHALIEGHAERVEDGHCSAFSSRSGAGGRAPAKARSGLARRACQAALAHQGARLEARLVAKANAMREVVEHVERRLHLAPVDDRGSRATAAAAAAAAYRTSPSM